EDPRGREHDALRALAMRMRAQDQEDWPHLLLLLGDQVYADEVPPATAEFIASRRDPSVPPGEQVADFEEYCRLYRDSWSEPAVCCAPTPATWLTPRSGTASSAGRRARSTTSCSARRCPRSSGAACTSSRRGTRRCARARGAAWPRGSPSACARRSTSSTGRR